VRFLQCSLLVPLYQRAKVGSRAWPIRFEEVSPVQRPRPKASKETWKQYRKACQLHNLSTAFVESLKQVRQNFDLAGAVRKILVFAADALRTQAWQFL